MQMKKKFTALLLVLCLFGVTESQVLAGPSAGGKCVTVGKFATVNATTLVCTKIGSAKVWVALDKSAFAAPTVVSVAIAPSSTLTYYLQGQTIYVIVQFSSPVFVTGVPQIFLDSANIGKMSYIAGSGTSALLFAYVTVAGDVDNDGFGLKANSLTLNGGTIKDANGTAANLTHVAIAKSSTRKLTATAPAPVATTTTVATGATTTTVATTTTTTAATTTTTTTDNFVGGLQRANQREMDTRPEPAGANNFQCTRRCNWLAIHQLAFRWHQSCDIPRWLGWHVFDFCLHHR
jgi:hypothetical protein